jgi:hypothetical protein
VRGAHVDSDPIADDIYGRPDLGCGPMTPKGYGRAAAFSADLTTGAAGGRDFAAISVSDGQGNIDRMLAKMQRRHN